MSDERAISRRGLLLGLFSRPDEASAASLRASEAAPEDAIAVLQLGDCLAWQGTFCTVCSERCPVDGAIEVRAGRPTIVADRCTGCGDCQDVCPAPYNAVVIIPRAAVAEAAEPACSEPVTDPVPDQAAASATFDWRAAYFGGRSLGPPV